MRQGDRAPCRLWIPQSNLHEEPPPMPDIMVLLACLSQCIEPTPLRHLGRVIEAMWSMSGRVTLRGLSRCAGHGGRDRTVHRFFLVSVHWLHISVVPLCVQARD